MERTDAKAAPEHICPDEVFVSFLGSRLRDTADVTEVELPGFSTEGVLGGQVFANRQAGRPHAHVIARAQITAGHAWHHDVFTISSTSDQRSVWAKTLNAQRRTGWGL